jgi:hypothetical protein
VRDRDASHACIPVNDTWATNADMPTARDVFTAAAVNRKLYAVGGSSIDKRDWIRSFFS